MSTNFSGIFIILSVFLVVLPSARGGKVSSHAYSMAFIKQLLASLEPPVPSRLPLTTTTEAPELPLSLSKEEEIVEMIERVVQERQRKAAAANIVASQLHQR